MNQSITTVAGIDVGGELKGFHAVSLREGVFVNKISEANPSRIVEWCWDHDAEIVAIDAPCEWSKTGFSRLAERELKLFDTKIHCFMTPTRDQALKNKKKFYEWVINGERLFQLLMKRYHLFNGFRELQPTCFETFPQAITCALAGKVMPAKHKASIRRQVLRTNGYEIGNLSNIDFVDAALCAIAADKFRKDEFLYFGDTQEGFIVVPKANDCAINDREIYH